MHPTNRQKKSATFTGVDRKLNTRFSGILRRPTIVAVVVLTLLLSLALFVSQAATIEWANAGSDWATGGNWVGGTAPVNGTGTDIASFGSTGASPVNPNLGVARSANGVSFLSGAYAYTLGGSTLTIGTGGITDSATNIETFSNQINTSTSETWTSNGGSTLVLNGTVDLATTASSSRTLTLNGSGDATFGGVIQNSGSSSTGSLTYSGTGTLTLNNANTINGTSTVNSGTVALGNNGAIGTSGLTLTGGTVTAVGGARTITNNAIISTSNGTIGGANNLTLNGTFTNSGGNRTLTVGNSATTTLGGSVFLSETSGTGRTLTITGPGNLVLGGAIANFNGAGAAGSLTFNGSYTGTATINGTNTYSGNTLLSSGGTFVLGNKAAFGASVVALNGVSISANSDLSGANAIANTSNNGGNNTFTGSNNIEFSGPFTDTGTRTLTNNMSGLLKFSGGVNLSNSASNFSLTINGSGNTLINSVVANGGSSTASNLLYSGTGALTLSGANTYAGTTTITSGTMLCGAANTLPSASAMTLNGGTLKTGATSGFNQSTGTIKLTDSSAIALGSGTHTLTFAASNAVSWTAAKTLTIMGWLGGYNGTSGTAGQIFVGSSNTGLTAGQLAQIFFFDGSKLYPATILSTGEVVPLSGPTAVKLMSFTATRNGDTVMLQWQSGFEAHNLGYYVYREQNGERTRITPSIVAGSALRVGRQTVLSAGYSYTWYDQISEVRDQRSVVTYWLEDIDLNGTRTLHGPVAPFIAGSSPRKEGAARSPLLNEVQVHASATGKVLNGWPTEMVRQEPRATSARVSGANVSITQGEIAATPGVKLRISKAGWYRVTQPELAAAGLDPNASASQLQLFANGQEVPIKVSGNGGQLTPSDYIEFYGHELSALTDAAQTYYLLVGNSAGQRVTVVNNGLVGAPSGPQSYNYTIERKDRTIYYAALLNGEAENIFGQVVTSTPASLTLPVHHPEIAAGGQAQLEISLVGVSFEDHHVHVTLNGADVGTVDFSMVGQPDQTFAVPASLLHEGENTVQFTSLGGSSDVSLVDTLRLTYAHSYTADNDALSISVAGLATTRVNGFSKRDLRAVDITDPNNIQELTPVVAAQTDGSYTADVQIAGASTAQPHTLLVFSDGQTAHPDSIKYNEPSSWRANANGADYLIITSHDFVSRAQTLARYRATQGLVSNVVDVEDLYDEFTFGMHSPQAIRDFLQTASLTWAVKPRYVLLMGDASFDPKNYLGQGQTDFVPTKLCDTSLMETASDDWLADFNDDGVADLSIGRLPVRTSSDANLMVNKIIAYENMPYDPQRFALLVADREFEAASAGVQTVLPASMPKQLINRSSNTDSAVHIQIVNSINRGPQLVNYLGHGSNGVWTGARLLANADASSLTNSNSLSVFVMMTCLNGYFEDAYNDSLAEALMRTPGGAVAVWASSGMAEPASQNLVDMELYRQLFNGQSPRLGDAIRAAKAKTNDADIRRTWTLFGDPALRLTSATPAGTNSTVGGIITDGAGLPLAGTTINLSGAQTRQTITDNNGSYTFDNLEANGSYTVTPARVNYTFSPASRSFSSQGLHTDASFTATAGTNPVNPLDTTEYFVRQQYLDFLGREPDESGFNFWTNQIRSCGSDRICADARRINVSAAFFLSIEFQQTGYLVYRAYKSAFGDLPNSPVPITLNEFLSDTKQIGQGVVVNQAGWEQLLENNKQRFMADFVQRSRFSAADPTTLTPAEFVDRLFANAAVTPFGSDRADAISEFGSAATTSDVAARARALRRVAENSTLTQKEFNRAFVLTQYFGYLRRNPIDAPELTRDYQGYNFWLEKLDRFKGNFVEAEMVKAFLVSVEYRQRFGP